MVSKGYNMKQHLKMNLVYSPRIINVVTFSMKFVKL
jgi:hypothetical protein